MQIKNITLTLLACLVTLGSMAQQSPPPGPRSYSFTLQEAINYAYAHNDSLKNAALDIKSAGYQVKETIASGLPQINGSASFQYYFKTPVAVGPSFKPADQQPNPANPFDPANIDKDAPVQVFPFGPIRSTSVFSVQATQLLFSGTFIVGLQAVKTFKELSQRNFSRTKIETNAAVTKAYYQYLVSTEQIRLLDANIKQLKQQLDETTASNKQGFVEKIDVDRLSVQYNNLVTNRENAVRSLDLGNQMLKFQMGMPVEDNLTLTDKLDDVNLGGQTAQNSVDTAFYRNRIEYQLLETNITLNELDVKSKKAEFLPSLSMNGGVNYVFQENNLRFLFDRSFPNSYIGLSLNVPIFSSGLRLNQLRQKQVNVEKAKNDLHNAVNGFKIQANAASVTYTNNLQSLTNQKNNQKLAQEVLRVSRIKYQQGVGSSIEVSQAQTALEQADNQYIEALYNLMVSKVELDKAYGRIN